MRTRKGPFTLLLGLAATLAILPLSAQVPRDPRGPTHPQKDQSKTRGDDDTRSARAATALWSIDWDRAGVLAVAARSPREMQFWDGRLAEMQQSGDLRLRRLQDDTQIAGRQHQRFDQYHRGVRVFGGGVVGESQGGRTVSAFGILYTGISLDVTPVLTPEQALAVFDQATGQGAAPSLEPELVILPTREQGFVLTYRVTGFTGLELPVLFVNAATGAVEHRYNNLQTQTPAIGAGNGVFGDQKKVSVALLNGSYVASDQMRPPALLTYDLKGNFARGVGILSGSTTATWNDVAATPDNDAWSDPAVVDGHAYLGWVYDYYFKRFGRRGMDNADAPIRSMVHIVRRGDAAGLSEDVYFTFVINAFWCPSCGADHRGYLVLGDGTPSGYYDLSTGKSFNFLAGGLDVVAHELTHGVTSYSSDLIYENESGALNEAFSDIMGTGAEFFFQQAGNGLMKADYTIGEDIATPGTPSGVAGLRSLADPQLFGDPDHYSMRYLGTEDNGGVHTNSLIAGHAFYLAIEGGRNRTSGQAVQGVGATSREQIERVFYRAFTYYLPSNATFSVARAATIRAAQDLYGPGSAAERAITQAWSAVGVL